MPTSPVTAAIMMGLDHCGTLFIQPKPGKFPSNTSALCGAVVAGQRTPGDNHGSRRWRVLGEEGVGIMWICRADEELR